MSKPLKISIRLLLIPIIIIGGLFFASLNGSYSKFESDPTTVQTTSIVTDIEENRDGLQVGDPTQKFLVTYTYEVNGKDYLLKKEQDYNAVGTNSRFYLDKNIPIIYNSQEPAQSELKLSLTNKLITDHRYYFTPPLAILIAGIFLIDIFRIMLNKKELLSV